MSLSLPTAYEYAAKSAAFKENWFMMLYYDTESAYLGIAEKDVIVDSKQFYGVVLEWSDITYKIDLANSRAAIPDVEITCSNVLKNGLLSDELYGGSRKYLNRKVKIYAHADDDSTLANCVQVFEGYLKNASPADLSTVKLSAEGIHPAYGIKVPNTKASIRSAVNPAVSSDVYIPVAYGDFDPDTSTNFFSAGYYYPMPFVYRGSKLYFLPAQAYGSPVADSVAFHDSNLDKFLPLDNADTSTSTYQSNNIIGVDLEVTRTALVRPSEDDASDTSADTEKGYDIDSDGSNNTTTYAYKNETSSGSYDFVVKTIEAPVGKCTQLVLHLHAEAGMTVGVDGDDYVTIISELYGESDPVAAYDGSDPIPGSDLDTNWTHDYTTEYTANNSKLPTTIPVQLNFQETTGINGYARIYAAWLECVCALDFTNDAEAAETFIKDFKTAYCSRDGLDQSYTDNDGGIADLPHEIFRDLLKRNTDFDYDNDYMKGFSATNQYLSDDLNSARSGWTCHWWALEPVDLQEVLDQIQYEGCFIMIPVFDSDGSGNAGAQWIWVHDSYASGDVTQTLTEDDYSKIKLGLTDLSEIVTKYIFNYDRNAATNKYRKSETFTNSNRSDYFPNATNENVIEKNLDFITADKVTSGSDPNDSIGYYYDNISGEPKMIVKCKITNMTKANITVGDIIKFNDADIDPYGKTWSDLYFMAVETKRLPGALEITAREVYST